jgi:hypothetical protein
MITYFFIIQDHLNFLLLKASAFFIKNFKSRSICIYIMKRNKFSTRTYIYLKYNKKVHFFSYLNIIFALLLLLCIFLEIK